MGIPRIIRTMAWGLPVLGLFFGINLVFNGASQLALGHASRTEPVTVS